MSSVYVIGNLDREVVNFEGERVVYRETKQGTKYWTVALAITTLMESFSNDPNKPAPFEEKMRAAKIGRAVQHSTDNSIKLNLDEYTFLMNQGKEKLFTIVLDTFMEEMEMAEKMNHDPNTSDDVHDEGTGGGGE